MRAGDGLAVETARSRVLHHTRRSPFQKQDNETKKNSLAILAGTSFTNYRPVFNFK